MKKILEFFQGSFPHTEKRQVQSSWEAERYVELFKENGETK